jgi:hypothetical protein
MADANKGREYVLEVIGEIYSNSASNAEEVGEFGEFGGFGRVLGLGEKQSRGEGRYQNIGSQSRQNKRAER